MDKMLSSGLDKPNKRKIFYQIENRLMKTINITKHKIKERNQNQLFAIEILWKSTIHNGRDANSLVEGLTSILQAFAH